MAPVSLLHIALVTATAGSFTVEDGYAINLFLPRVPISVTADGRWLAYCTQNRVEFAGGGGNSAYSSTGVMIEMERGTIWVTDVENGTHENLTRGWGSSWAPRWSPDGRALAFYSDKSGEPHLYVWDRLTGEYEEFASATARTFFGFEVPKWTPDGRAVVYKALSEEPPKTEPTPTNAPEADPPFVTVWDSRPRERDPEAEPTPSAPPTRGWGDTDIVLANRDTGEVARVMTGLSIRGYDISPDGARLAVMVRLGSERPGTQQQVMALYVCPLASAGWEGRPLRDDIRQDYGISFTWSPDSRSLAYTTSGQLAEGDVYVVDVATSDRRNLTEDVPDDFGQAYEQPLWTPDGTALVCAAGGNVWRIPVDGLPPRNVTESCDSVFHNLARPTESPMLYLADGGTSVIVGGREPDGTGGIYRVDLDSGSAEAAFVDTARVLSLGRFEGDVGAATGDIFFFAQSAREPSDLWRLPPDATTATRVTDTNPHLRDIDTGEIESIEWTTEPGVSARGILVTPTAASREAPAPMIAVVYAGGMPSRAIGRFGVGQAVQTEHPALFTSRGYAVLYPDMPMDGPDRAEQISEAADAFLDAAIATGKVDAERIGVYGHSFGGYTVNVLITRTTRFRAAIAGASRGNLVSGFLESSNTGYYETGQVGMAGTLWEHRERYIENSPVFRLDRVETPLLLIHGDEDFIPVTQAREMYFGLARLGKDVALAEYREADHWPGFWSNEKHTDFWARFFRWFDEYLEPEASRRE